jgi:putative RNA 2'-phosphotransferase
VTKNSKFLSSVLRHNPSAIGLHVDDEGWVPVDDLLAALAAHGRPLSPDQLEQLIVGTDKQRFETHDGRIRAAQGHSIHVDLGLTPVVPPDLLFHGTVERFLPRIEVEGLLPMSRNVVHLSADPATARTVGARDERGVHDDGQQQAVGPFIQPHDEHPIGQEDREERDDHAACRTPWPARPGRQGRREVRSHPGTDVSV